MDKVFMVRIETVDEDDSLLNVSFHGAFKSFRDASHWLINEGLEVYYEHDLSELFEESIISFSRTDGEFDEHATIEMFSIQG